MVWSSCGPLWCRSLTSKRSIHSFGCLPSIYLSTIARQEVDPRFSFAAGQATAVIQPRVWEQPVGPTKPFGARRATSQPISAMSLPATMKRRAGMLRSGHLACLLADAMPTRRGPRIRSSGRTYLGPVRHSRRQQYCHQPLWRSRHGLLCRSDDLCCYRQLRNRKQTPSLPTEKPAENPRTECRIPMEICQRVCADFFVLFLTRRDHGAAAAPSLRQTDACVG